MNKKVQKKIEQTKKFIKIPRKNKTRKIIQIINTNMMIIIIPKLVILINIKVKVKEKSITIIVEILHQKVFPLKEKKAKTAQKVENPKKIKKKNTEAEAEAADQDRKMVEIRIIMIRTEGNLEGKEAGSIIEGGLIRKK